MEATQLVERAARLRKAVSDYKHTIRRTRAELAKTVSALATIEAECQRRGIRLVLYPAGEEEQSSWPPPVHNSRS